MAFYQKVSITMSGCGSHSGIASSYVDVMGVSFMIPVDVKDGDVDNEIRELASYYEGTLKALSE